MRTLTRSIARWLYEQKDAEGNDLIDGVEFRSRHGDDFYAWAVFERADDAMVSPHITSIQSVELTPETPDLLRALTMLGLTLA